MTSHSPIPNNNHNKDLLNRIEQHQMTFPEAMKEVIDGKKVTRISWGNIKHYGLLIHGVLALHKAGEDGETYYSWIVNDGDLFATDWVAVDSLN